MNWLTLIGIMALLIGLAFYPMEGGAQMMPGYGYEIQPMMIQWENEAIGKDFSLDPKSSLKASSSTSGRNISYL